MNDLLLLFQLLVNMGSCQNGKNAVSPVRRKKLKMNTLGVDTGCSR